jgi:hypothetical protein
MKVIALKAFTSIRFDRVEVGQVLDMHPTQARKLLDVKAVKLHEDEVKALQERRAESLKKDAKLKKASK